MVIGNDMFMGGVPDLAMMMTAVSTCYVDSVHQTTSQFVWRPLFIGTLEIGLRVETDAFSVQPVSSVNASLILQC